MDFLTHTTEFLTNTTVAGLGLPKPLYGADLYAGTDVSSLNFLEKAWMNWYLYFGNPILATGLMSFLLHEIVYFGRAIPFIIVDAMPSMRKYKLQEDRVATPEQQWKCTLDVLFSHFTIEGPLIWAFHPICEWFQLATHSVPFPPVTKSLWQIGVFFLFEDTFHYWAHRGLHWGPLYKHIHKKHHEFSAPFGLAAEYAHPLEVMILACGTILGPFFLCFFTRDLHIITVYAWITMRLFQAIDAHSGYDFPFSMHNWVPFWAGADHHDHHHQTFVGCYSTSFRWWDHLMGTDQSYKRTRARQAEVKRQAKEQGLQWPTKPATKTATGAPLAAAKKSQ